MTVRSIHAGFGLFVAMGVFGAGCLPPPSTLPLEGVRRDPRGTVSVGAFGTYAGDLAGNPAGAAGIRVAGQVGTNVAVGADVVGGGGRGPDVTGPPPQGSAAPTSHGGQPFSLAQTRLHLRYNPNSDHVALVVGAGGGVMLGTSTSTPRPLGSLDLGVRVGTGASGLVEAYLSQSFAMVVLGSVDSNPADRALFTVTEVGVLVRPTPRLAVGAHLGMTYNLAEPNQWTRPAFLPSLSVRYGFGGP